MRTLGTDNNMAKSSTLGSTDPFLDGNNVTRITPAAVDEDNKSPSVMFTAAGVIPEARAKRGDFSLLFSTSLQSLDRLCPGPPRHPLPVLLRSSAGISGLGVIS